jgi:phage terminase large subunit GpA-like protein
VPLLDSDKLLAGIVRKRLRPPRRLSVDEWADEYRIVLDPSPRPGRWRTDDVPYTREPMRDFTDPEVTRIVMCWAPQVAKTEVLTNCILYTIDRDPYPMMLVMDSRETVRDHMKLRVEPTMQAMPIMRQHMLSGRDKNTVQLVQYDTCTLASIGANSKGRLSSKPIGRLFLDERDKYPTSLAGRGGSEAGAADLAYKRLGAFGDQGKAMEASSPSHESIGIWPEYMKSDQARYFVPCPHCSHYQFLRFKGIRWEGGDGSDLDDTSLAELITSAGRSAWYACEKCDERIEHHHKPLMLRRGVWLRLGQEIKPTPGGELFGEQAIVGDAPDTNVRGYQLSRIYAPWTSFGAVAAAFISKRGDIDQDFVNGWLGEPWRDPGTRGDEGRILERAKTYNAAVSGDGGKPDEVYRKGEAPHAAQALLGACDVQRDGVYYLLVGLGAGEAVYAVDWGFLECPEIPAAEQELADISQQWGMVIERMWRAVPKAGTGEAMRVHTWAIDSGYRTGEVYRFCAHMGPWVIPTKGQEQQTQPLAWTPIAVDGALSGAKSMDRAVRAGLTVDLMSMNVNHWKDQLYASLGRNPPQVGAWRFPLDVESQSSGGWDLLRQLTAEERRLVKVGRRERMAWMLRPGRKDNHYFDCAVGVTALGRHLGMEDIGTPGRVVADNPSRPAAPGSMAMPMKAARIGLPRASPARVR